jgi:hypothetical protein
MFMTGRFFGPELGFGFNIDIPEGDKVLLVKTAWGGKKESVYWSLFVYNLKFMMPIEFLFFL